MMQVGATAGQGESTHSAFAPPTSSSTSSLSSSSSSLSLPASSSSPVDVRPISTTSGAAIALLHDAVKLNSYDNVITLLTIGAEVNEIDRKTGQTAMHVAAACNALNSLKALFEKGGSVNATDNAGDTPMDLAVRNRNEEAVELLKHFERASVQLRRDKLMGEGKVVNESPARGRRKMKLHLEGPLTLGGMESAKGTWPAPSTATWTATPTTFSTTSNTTHRPIPQPPLSTGSPRSISDEGASLTSNNNSLTNSSNKVNVNVDAANNSSKWLEREREEDAKGRGGLFVSFRSDDMLRDLDRGVKATDGVRWQPGGGGRGPGPIGGAGGGGGGLGSGDSMTNGRERGFTVAVGDGQYAASGTGSDGVGGGGEAKGGKAIGAFRSTSDRSMPKVTKPMYILPVTKALPTPPPREDRTPSLENLEDMSPEELRQRLIRECQERRKAEEQLRIFKQRSGSLLSQLKSKYVSSDSATKALARRNQDLEKEVSRLKEVNENATVIQLSSTSSATSSTGAPLSASTSAVPTAASTLSSSTSNTNTKLQNTPIAKKDSDRSSASEEVEEQRNWRKTRKMLLESHQTEKIGLMSEVEELRERLAVASKDLLEMVEENERLLKQLEDTEDEREKLLVKISELRSG